MCEEQKPVLLQAVMKRSGDTEISVRVKKKRREFQLRSPDKRGQGRSLTIPAFISFSKLTLLKDK